MIRKNNLIKAPGVEIRSYGCENGGSGVVDM
jgi:hypothetical protein